MVVKLQGWDPAYAKSVAQACLSALKQLILSDKKLPGTYADLFVHSMLSGRSNDYHSFVIVVKIVKSKRLP